MLKFYQIESGYMDGWQGHFVLATSPQDAADRYTRRIKAMYAGWNYDSNRTIEAKVYEADFDEFGVLRNVGELDAVPVLTVQVPD